MKNIFIYVSLLGSLTSLSAFADFVPFTTTSQAAQYCPDPSTALTFQPTRQKDPTSSGKIIGVHNDITFNNVEPIPALGPQFLSSSTILEASFRKANGWYGYNSNNVISCFYAYPADITKQSTGVVLRQQ